MENNQNKMKTAEEIMKEIKNNALRDMGVTIREDVEDKENEI